MRLTLLLCLAIAGCDPTPATVTPEPASAETGADSGDIDRSCATDDDCAKVYADCSSCNCEAVNVDDAWTMADLDCDTYAGPVCDYDCVQLDDEWAECEDGVCVMKGLGW